ncbi:hypothetical protein OROGR_031471 [Orobanche gracilis]
MNIHDPMFIDNFNIFFSPKGTPADEVPRSASSTGCDGRTIYSRTCRRLEIRRTRMRSITNAGDGIKSYVLLGMRYASFL